MLAWIYSFCLAALLAKLLFLLLFFWLGPTAIVQARQPWAGRRGSSAEAVWCVSLCPQGEAGRPPLLAAVQQVLSGAQRCAGFAWDEGTGEAHGSKVTACLPFHGRVRFPGQLLDGLLVSRLHQ